MISPMYPVMYCLHNFVFACLMISFMYSFYYLDMNVFLYSVILSILAFSILYFFSKNAPIKRRQSDYDSDNNTPIESNA